MNQQLTMEPILPQQSDTLHQIIQLANELRTTSEEADALAIDLKKKQERLKQLAEDHLPLLMTSVGLTELALVGGGKIKIKPDYYGSVAQTRMDQAFDWLTQRNMAGIVKTEFKIEASEISKEEIAKIEEETGFPITTKRTIHPATLKSFVKERMEANDPEFPKELFAASMVQKAVLTS